VKYVRTAGFLADLRRLPDEHRKMFAAAVHELLRPALDAGAHTGAAPWPRALRIHRIGRDYSMTWSFAGPDGRALFRLAEVAGDPVVICVSGWVERHPVKALDLASSWTNLLATIRWVDERQLGICLLRPSRTSTRHSPLAPSVPLSAWSRSALTSPGWNKPSG
jgi:hypothetical protein